MRRTIVLVLGPPAAGKTTLARALAAATGLPLVSKDDLKELLFDAIGVGDRAWSRRLGRASFAVLDRVVDLQLAGGGSFVVETPFDVSIAGPRFAARNERYAPRWIQVRCTAPDDVLLARFAQRAATDRHPGHADAGNLDEFAELLRSPRTWTFELPGPLLVVDTSLEPTAESIARIRTLLLDEPGGESPRSG